MRLFFTTILFLLCQLCYSEQLPIVRISGGDFSTEFSSASFQLEDGEIYPVLVRYRGASALKYEKKSFSVKFVTEEGDKQNVSLLGMRSDNVWVLDAMSVDMSRMRNRVSMDLWNDFSRKSYISEMEPEMINGTRGEYVELYLNDEYWGLYCLSERIDRKQLKLKKYKNDKLKGLLVKSKSWCKLRANGPQYYDYDNNSVQWQGWSMEYPDMDDISVIDWSPFVEDVKWFNTASDSMVRAELRKKIDLPVWRDYYLMMELMAADDNIYKNQYLYYYDVTDSDRMLGIAPWDMDNSWGRDYKGDKEDANININVVSNKICALMDSVLDPDYYFKKRRYDELRNQWFSKDSLNVRFDRYFALFERTGAGNRECERWNGTDGFSLNFEEEKAYIKQWISDRLAYMDKKYGYEEESIPLDLLSYPLFIVSDGSIMISGIRNETLVYFFDLKGRLLNLTRAQLGNVFWRTEEPVVIVRYDDKSFRVIVRNCEK